MSLYIGHLSPRIRREELERNFRRFGRCSVQLKDGYGFVVYELAANAERALRALRGKIVCGEQISINWSNRQPRPFQRSAKSSRFNGPYHGRNFREGGDDGVGISSPHDRKELLVDDHEGHISNDAVDIEVDEMNANIVNTGEEKGEKPKEVMVEQGDMHDPVPVENDRWGGPDNDTLAGNGLENGDEFNRYEPYHGYNRRDENEKFQKAGSYDSSDQGNLEENRRREKSAERIVRNIDKSKPQVTCYNCGQVGHIMRRCPQAHARREKFRFMKRDEANFRDEGNPRLNRFKPNLWGRSNSNRNSLIPSRRHTTDRKEIYPEKARRVPRESEISPESRGNQQVKFRGDSQRNKRSRIGKETSKKSSKRSKARQSHSSSSSDSSTATSRSQSQSQSKRSCSGTSSRSCSRLMISRSRPRSLSASSSSRSSSTSSYSKSVNSRSRSRSRSKSSTPRSLSLSVSLEGKLTPSAKNKQVDVCSNGSSPNNLKGSKQKQLEDTKLTGTYAMLEGKATITPFKVDTETNGEHPMHYGCDAQYSAYGIGYNLSNSCGDMPKDEGLTNEHHSQMAQMGNQQIAPSEAPTRETSVKCEGNNSLSIASEEMVLALKHYGLTEPKEGQLDISVEEYFGAARLWPWQMIYYRRLKKGPISTENYARRLEQNREFGIVDKYVRSSSGWNENHESSI